MPSVLITGVSKGIGRAIAELFLSEGYTVYGTFFNDRKQAQELVEKYNPEKIKLFGPFDFTNIENTREFLKSIKGEKFDSLIFNAGLFSSNDDFNNFEFEDFVSVMNCNFYTPLLLTVNLKEQINNGGSIVVVSSNDAYYGAYSSMSYTISKAALLSLMKCLCVNFGSRNIRVNAVAPGAINTDMNTTEQEYIAPYFTPVSRIGTPLDVARVVLFLASEKSNFINGENITIDGGYNTVSLLLKCESDNELSESIQTFIEKQKQEII